MHRITQLFYILLVCTGSVRAGAPSSNLESNAWAPQPLPWRMDVVFKNPGEGPTPTKYTNAAVVADLGYNIMTVADGRPPHTAITWDSFDPSIFPNGSAGRQWVEDLGKVIDDKIDSIHRTGMKAMYWFDMFVLPRTLVDKYKDEIIDSEGRWSFDSEMMTSITEYMVDAVFRRFPALDGLLVRTGEIYTQDVPYHQGASPITEAHQSHIALISVLKDVVISKHDKMLFYRTWSFDGFTSDPTYYLNVTDAIEPHSNLVFVIKHTTGDFWRTVKFNPTINIGKHQYVVEIQCQREYEGKGAFPNYVMSGVIDGFEENANDAGLKSLSDLSGSSLYKGIVTWARGGGWIGPYPADEFWIDMNVRVIAKWAQDPSRAEDEIFSEYAGELGFFEGPQAISTLREIALLSARGVLLGHYSLQHQLQRLLWTRDWYIGGGDKELEADFANIIGNDSVAAVLDEKAEAVQIWDQIVEKTDGLTSSMTGNGDVRDFLHYSVRYGQLLYKIIEASWIVSLLGTAGNTTGTFEIEEISQGIASYDEALATYLALSGQNTSQAISSPYTPFGWGGTTQPDPVTGANNSVNVWRYLVTRSK